MTLDELRKQIQEVRTMENKLREEYQKMLDTKIDEMLDYYKIDKEVAKKYDTLLEEGYVLTSMVVGDREQVVLSKVLKKFSITDEDVFNNLAQ